MDETWYSKIESTIISQVEYMLKRRADAPYPSLNITSKSQETKPASLPTMYIHELESVERGHDLDNATVNAIMHTMEIQVWTNGSQNECKSILTAAITEMKRMRYNIIMFPKVKTNDGLAWGVFRARRVIGAGDKL